MSSVRAACHSKSKDRFDEKPTRHKAQHLRRHGIQPLWVIHDRPPTRQTMPQQFQRGVWKPPRK
jgi:hypothetical protein